VGFWRHGGSIRPGRQFAEGGTHSISLAVTDANHVTATDELLLTLNRPPIASFAASCESVECIFDPSLSSDPDGRIVDYDWMFGDGSGQGGGGAAITHSYKAAGTFPVSLRVTDDTGGTGTHSVSVTIPGVHIGDLDAAASPTRSSWTASVTVLVHDDAHRPVANATVTGSWSGSPGSLSSCRTADSGACTTTSDVLPNAISSIPFNVLSVVSGTGVYDATRNHDVDGGTNGTTVTVRRR
jgi:hypothetical protein